MLLKALVEDGFSQFKKARRCSICFNGKALIVFGFLRIKQSKLLYLCEDCAEDSALLLLHDAAALRVGEDIAEQQYCSALYKLADRRMATRKLIENK